MRPPVSGGSTGSYHKPTVSAVVRCCARDDDDDAMMQPTSVRARALVRSLWHTGASDSK